MIRGSFRPEINSAPKDLEELAIELAELDPKPVTNFTPDNLKEVRERFLAGDTYAINDLTYNNLDELDFDARSRDYSQMGKEVSAHPAIPQNHQPVYEEYLDRNILINELMRQAVIYRSSQGEEKEQARRIYTNINNKLYGEPKEETAAIMVGELLADTEKTGNDSLKEVRGDFISLLPAELLDSSKDHNSLKVPEEVKEFTKNFVDYVYSPLLSRVDEFNQQKGYDETAKIDAQVIAEVFQHIIDTEFPDSGWSVAIENCSAIKVVASTKQVIVPVERKSVSINKLKGLVVHELGIHMMRSIIGEGADLIPLRLGFAGSGEAEEGWAKLLESTVVGGEERTGYQYYLTATLLNKGYNFRQVFDVMWRYKVLDAYLDNSQSEVNDAFTEKQKRAAFNFVFRTVRGTNELPWLIVLNYFNGTQGAVEYIKINKDSPEMMTLPFLGKIDPLQPNHVRGALNAVTRY
jgi:hypothetical protein